MEFNFFSPERTTEVRNNILLLKRIIGKSKEVLQEIETNYNLHKIYQEITKNGFNRQKINSFLINSIDVVPTLFIKDFKAPFLTSLVFLPHFKIVSKES